MVHGFASRSLQIIINFFFGIFIIHSISIEAFGKYAFILALSRFIPAFLRFNNIHIFIRKYKFKEEKVYRAFLTKYFTYVYLLYSTLFIFLIIAKFSIPFEVFKNFFIIYVLLIIFGEHVLNDLVVIYFNLKNPSKAYNLSLFFNIFKILPFIFIALFFHTSIKFELLLLSLASQYSFFLIATAILLLKIKNYNFSVLNKNTILPFSSKSLFATNMLTIFSSELPIFIVNSFFTPVVIGIFSFINSIAAAIMNVIQFGYVNKQIPIYNEYIFKKDKINANKFQKKIILDIFVLCTLAFAPFIIFFDILNMLADWKISGQKFLLVLFYFSSILFLASGSFQKLFIYEFDRLILKLQLSRLAIFVIIFIFFYNTMSLKALLISMIISLIIFSFMHLYFEKKYN